MRCLCPAGWIQVSFGLNQICLHSGKYVNRFREGKDDSNGVAHERKTKRPVPPRWGSVGYAAQRSGLFQPIWPKHHCCSGWFTPCWNAFNRDLSTFYGQHRWFSVKSSIWEFFFWKFRCVFARAGSAPHPWSHERRQIDMCAKYKPDYKSV